MEKLFVFLGYVWRVVFNLIQLLVVLYILDKVKGDFQVIVVAVLGIIYATIRTIGFGLALSFINTGQALEREFKRLRHLLNDQLIEEDEVELVEQKTQAKRLIAKSYIDMVSVSIIWLFCVVSLLRIQ
jgi:hypothetical protein